MVLKVLGFVTPMVVFSLGWSTWHGQQRCTRGQRTDAVSWQVHLEEHRERQACSGADDLMAA